MGYGNNVAIVGNLTRDPELRFSNSGMAVARLSVAVSKRRGDGEEKPGFYDVVCFREMAENVAESLTKGSRVMVTGELSWDSWEDRETGAKRSKVEILADDIGPSMRWATAEVQRNERSDGGGGRGGGGGYGGGGSRGGDSGGGGRPYNPDEEPF